MDIIPISEIFGPTLQGEGSMIGTPTVFVRSGGCDYECRWCDTPYASRPNTCWVEMSAAGIFETVKRLAGAPMWVTLTGGNPAIHDFTAFLEMCRDHHYPVAMETQGSVSAQWFAKLDYMTISPKPPSSGNATSKDTVRDCIGWYGSDKPLCIKVVVSDGDDFDYAKAVSDWFGSMVPVYLQPNRLNCPAPTDQLMAMKSIFTQVQRDQRYNFRILPQLQRLLWGDGRAV